MRRNSFKVRPPGFTRHFPETPGAAKFDIRYPGGFHASRKSRLMQSPQDCSGGHKNGRRNATRAF
jgi:hypothetical protein